MAGLLRFKNRHKSLKKCIKLFDNNSMKNKPATQSTIKKPPRYASSKQQGHFPPKDYHYNNRFCSKKDFYLYPIDDIKKELARSIEEQDTGYVNTTFPERQLPLLCLKILYNGNTKDTYKQLSKYLDTFDVTKKLNYATDGNPPSCDISDSRLVTVVWLSICCGLYSFYDPSLKMINCMLKLNDAIAASHEKITALGMDKLAWCARAIEQAIIRRVA